MHYLIAFILMIGLFAVYGADFMTEQLAKRAPTVSEQNAAPQNSTGSQTLSQSPQGDGQFRADPDGHVRLEARLDGRLIDFLVDTGASAVALRESDARRAGYLPTQHDYSVNVSTANGLVKAAPIMIREIELGMIRVTQIRGLVLPDHALSKNLLGMSFLSRMRRFEMSNGMLTLEQ